MAILKIPPNIPPIKQGLVLFVPDQARIPSCAPTYSGDAKSPGASRSEPDYWLTTSIVDESRGAEVS